MKKLLTILLLSAWSVTANAQMKISQYPNTATLASNNLFIVAILGSPGTNKNISYGQLSNLFANSCQTSLGYIPATNRNSGINSALGYTPATNGNLAKSSLPSARCSRGQASCRQSRRVKTSDPAMPAGRRLFWRETRRQNAAASLAFWPLLAKLALKEHPVQQFWVLPISSTMGRPAKTLLERVLAGSFRADRYGSLLAGELLPATSPFSDRRRRRIWQELRPDPSPPGWGWHPRRGSIVPGVPPGGSATLIRSEKGEHLNA